MIELKVEEYCHDCPDFSPEASSIVTVGGGREFNNTKCTCEYRKRCAAIARMIEKKYDIPPFEISVELYDQQNGYSKENLFYNIERDRLCYFDTKVELIYAEKRIGVDCMNMLKSSENLEETVYVRNDLLKIDYRIVRVF